MSELRRVFSSTRLSEKERVDEKENICDIKKFKNMADTNPQTVTSSKRLDSNYTGGLCYCKADLRKDANYKNFKSSTKKEPFKIHFDRACNDLNNEASVRERMIKYDAYRIEKLKKNTPLSENKQKSRFNTNIQQPEENSIRNHLPSIKNNKECLKNSLVSCDKTSIKSVKTVSGIQLQKLQIPATKSLLDLSQMKQSSHLRSRSCSNQRTVFVTRKRTNSTSGTNEGFIDQENQQSGSNKCKPLGESKESLFSDVFGVISSESSKKQVSTKILHKSKSGTISIHQDNYLPDQREQQRVNTISTKISN
ncbi:hypothetical protein M0804_013566 [Polistes exclamans]|nr:hypothetical protein M0804_013566 [Polistes exclamans]